MARPLQSLIIRTSFAAAALALGAAVALSPAAFAILPDSSMPSLSISDVKKGVDKPAPDSSTSTAAGSGGRGFPGSAAGSGSTSTGARRGNAASARRTSSSKGEVPYIITVRNGSEIQANNVVVEYHFYNRTANISNGIADYTIDDITSTEYLDLAPGKSKDVMTQPIPHEDTESTAAASGGRTRTVGGSTMTITSLLGWHIEVRYNDKLVVKKEYPDNLQTLLKLNAPKE